MGHLTVADLIARRVPLAASEAAALTLAVARLMDARRASGHGVKLPDDDWILLSSNGEVSIVEVHGSLETDETTGLSALLRRLLQLDERTPARRQSIVPGGLLIVLARNLGYIHLPATEPAAFRAALERFAAPDSAVLSAVFWRAASIGRDSRALRPATRRTGDALARPDRRQQGASRTDLRRALRDLEQELYELRAQVTSAAAEPAIAGRRGVPRATIAATLAASFVGALVVAALAGGGDATDRGTARGPDVVLAPEPSPVRIIPAVAALSEADTGPDSQTSSVEPPRRSEDAAPSRMRPVPAARDGAGRAQPADDPPSRGAKRPEPLAVHRGGTRGIAW